MMGQQEILDVLSTLSHHMKSVSFSSWSLDRISYQCTKLLAKYDALLVTTGCAISHGSSNSDLLERTWSISTRSGPVWAQALDKLCLEPPILAPQNVQNAHQILKEWQPHEETLAKPQMTVQVCTIAVWPPPQLGYMSFHQLVQVIAWIAEHHKSTDACNAERQACLSDGDSAQAVLVQLTGCLIQPLPHHPR